MIQDNTDIYGEIADSNRLVDRMKANFRKNKLILAAVAAILIFALIIILYAYF